MLKREFLKCITFVLIVGVSLIGSQRNLLAKNFEFFVNSALNFGYDTSSSPSPYPYWDWNSGYNYNSGIGYGSIDPSSFNNKFNFSAGINYYFNPHLGISLSVNHCNRHINLFSDILPEIVWANENFSLQASFEAFTSVSITPVMMDFLYKVFLFKNTNLNVYLGAGLIFTQFETSNHFNYWEYELTEFKNVDSYDMGNLTQENHTFFGGNFGLDIEHKISQRLGVFAGCQYFYLPKKLIGIGQDPFDITFTVSGQSESVYVYQEEFNKFIPQLTEVNLSYLRAFVGIKVYF